MGTKICTPERTYEDTNHPPFWSQESRKDSGDKEDRMKGRVKEVFIALVLTSSAGAPETPESPEYGSGEIKSIVSEIRRQAEAHGVPLRLGHIRRIGFGNTSPNAQGDCILGWSRMDTQIVLEKNEWERFSPCKKKWLLTHELAHCSMSLHQHDEESFFSVLTTGTFMEGMCEDVMEEFWTQQKEEL